MNKFTKFILATIFVVCGTITVFLPQVKHAASSSKTVKKYSDHKS